MISLMIFIGASICLLSHTSKGQDYNSCGTRSVNMRGRIIGGLQSRPGMWPWQVAIYRGVEKKFHCGGALINSRWILSAAHCFHSATNEKFKYTITTGDFNISSKDLHEQERNALKIYLHPDYDFRSYENDIALVELDKGVKMGLYIRTICLPKANENVSVPGKIGSVAGWGWTGRRKPSPVLLHSSYRIQTNEQCDQATNYPFNQSVMFCAGDGKGGNDTCKGDSGGSLVRQLFRDGTYRWVTVGLVSWGEDCARRHKYGYYTRMEPFVAWIQKKMNGSALSCGNPGNIPHGTMIGSDFLVGFTVKYTCSEGYQLRGKSKIRCKRNGKWTRAPTCQKAECRDPGEPRYGVRRPRKSKYFYKDKVRFRCQKNYTIIGRSIIVCQSDGMWDRYKPVCLECGSALGMENRKILDGNIRASSTRDPYRHTAKEGRLNGPRAWCSGRETQPYLEIDFGKPYRITGLATQGSAYDNRWVRWYSLKSNLAGSTFVAYREYGNTKLFEGNKDTNTHVKQKLRNPFIARRLQIHPIKQGGYHTYPACMRVEIYGCDLPLDCVVARSRVVAKWISLPSGMYIYLKAYLTNIGKRYWRVDLENENHDRLRYKLFPKYTVLPFVLDVPPKHEELQVGTRVLAPWRYRYFTGTIRRTRDRYNRYQVRADDYEVKYFTVDQIRLLKAPRFCE